MCDRSCHDPFGGTILKIDLPDSFRDLLQTMLIDTYRKADITLTSIAKAVSGGGYNARFVQ
jgi:hypothetical protein